MKSTSEYLKLLKQFKDSRAMSYGIQKIGLFGSVARGEHTEDSDVDVVYEGEPNILLRSRMKQELEVLFGCRVDLIRLRKQLKNTLFGESISEDLIFVWIKYKYRIDEEEIYRVITFDLKPLLEVIRRMKTELLEGKYKLFM